MNFGLTKGKVLKGHSKTDLIGSGARRWPRALAFCSLTPVVFHTPSCPPPHSRKGRRTKTFSYFESLRNSLANPTPLSEFTEVCEYAWSITSFNRQAWNHLFFKARSVCFWNKITILGVLMVKSTGRFASCFIDTFMSKWIYELLLFSLC